MSLPVRITPEADDQIGAIDDWWRRNRPAAPDLFVDELAASFETIGHTPQIGRLYRQSPVAWTRRVLLQGSRHHVTTVRALAM